MQSGVTLGTAFISGVTSGIADSAGSLETSINNEFLIEMLLISIGFMVVLLIIVALFTGHKRLGKNSDYGFYAPLNRDLMLSQSEMNIAMAKSRAKDHRLAILAKRYGGEDDIPLNRIDNREYNRVKAEGRA